MSGQIKFIKTYNAAGRVTFVNLMNVRDITIVSAETAEITCADGYQIEVSADMLHRQLGLESTLHFLRRFANSIQPPPDDEGAERI